MSEFLAIAEALGAGAKWVAGTGSSKPQAARDAAVLATLVEVQGSAFRRAGARWLMLADGRRLGAVTGGCLENQLAEHAGAMPQGAAPLVVRFDTTRSDDALLGSGMGCGGKLTVLLERVEPGCMPAYLAPADELLADGEAAVLVTVFAAEPEAGVEIGARLLWRPDKTTAFGCWDGPAVGAAAAAAQGVWSQGRSRTVRWGSPGSAVEALAERMTPPAHLLLFGATDLGQVVVQMAKSLGWRVTVCDRRETLANPLRFPRADAVIAAPVEELRARLPLKGRTAAVVMTHRYEEDLALLRWLLASEVGYIGVLGVRRRTEAMLETLAADGLVLTEANRRRIHAPVGLDLGAEEPGQIALAILAEVQAALAGRRGGMLRDRPGPIHGGGP